SLSLSVGRGLYIADPGVEIDEELKEPYERQAKALGAESSPDIEHLLRGLFAETNLTYLKLTGPEAYADHKEWFKRREREYDPAVRQRLENASKWTPEDTVEAAAHRDRLADTL